MPPPLALVALAFALGIVARERFALPALPCGLTVAAALALAVAIRARPRGFGLSVLATALSLGALAAATAREQAPDGILDGAAWDVRAHVLEAPESSAGRAHVLLALDEVARGGTARDVVGRVWLSLGGEPNEPLLPGDRVRFHARLLAPRGFAEPESPDPERRLAARGVIAVAGVPTPAAVVRLSPDPAEPSRGWDPVRAIAKLRRSLLGRVRAALDGDARALVESLVLGERGDVSPALDDAFRRAGVSHVLSVSGLHLALAAWLLFAGLGRALLHVEPLARRVAVRRIAALAALPATLLYTLLTGAAVATVRSCVAAWVWLGGVAIGRAASAGTAIGAAALAILAVSPLALYDPSFQLSFAATLGGATLAPRWIAAASALLPTAAPRRPWLLGLARAVISLIAVSAAAIAATAPIAAWHFGQVAPAGLLANVIVVPLAELIVLPLGLAACALPPWPIARTLSSLLLKIAGLGAGAMAAIVRAIAARAPAGALPAPTLAEALAWYAILLALLLSGRIGRRLTMVGVCGFLGVVSLRVIDPALRPRMRLTVLDVGQGDSALLELPGGAALLVDGGGSFDPAFDPGAQLLVPWLTRHGVRRLDAVVLTHPHPDHANGLAAVVERFPVGEVWTNGARSQLPGLARLVDAAARHGVPVVRPHRVDRGGAVVEVLHPLREGGRDPIVEVDPAWSENDGSIVLAARYAGRSILLSGDVEARAEGSLVARGAPLGADVLKAPHHGSRSSSTPRFVTAVHPELVVYSVGAANRWHFPSEIVDARWREAGARTLRTDRDGAVTVTIDRGGEIEVRQARAGPFAE